MKIQRWLRDEGLDVRDLDKVDDLLEYMGQELDKTIGAPILLFQLEDGTWKIGTIEFVISDPSPNFLEDELSLED